MLPSATWKVVLEVCSSHACPHHCWMFNNVASQHLLLVGIGSAVMLQTLSLSNMVAKSFDCHQQNIHA